MRGKDKRLTVHPERQIDEAVTWLRDHKDRMETELTLRAKEIGDYLIHHFFHDDLTELSSQNPAKNVSFKKLCERTDLPFAESALRRFIHVAVNFRFLPAEQARELPPSHHSVLYQVADPAERARIGADAAEREVSVRKLREMVKGKGRRRPGAGRKRESEFHKNWRQVVQAMEKLSRDLEGEVVLDREQFDEVWRETRTVHDHLNRVIDRILEAPQNQREKKD
jgi:hypothetical protein